MVIDGSFRAKLNIKKVIIKRAFRYRGVVQHNF